MKKIVKLVTSVSLVGSLLSVAAVCVHANPEIAITRFEVRPADANKVTIALEAEGRGVGVNSFGIRLDRYPHSLPGAFSRAANGLAYIMEHPANEGAMLRDNGRLDEDPASGRFALTLDTTDWAPGAYSLVVAAQNRPAPGAYVADSRRVTLNKDAQGVLELKDMRIEMEPIVDVTKKGEGFNAWGTVARVSPTQIWSVFSGGREDHVCPYGKVSLSRSLDDGQTWQPVEVLYGGNLDDRDAGLLTTPEGTILVTWFTSTEWRKYLNRAKTAQPGTPGYIEPQRLREWIAKDETLTDAVIRSEWGSRLIRSEDGGSTWSAPIDTKVNSPHGPTVLADGRLLYVGKEMWKSERSLAAVSTDDGKSWEVISEIPLRDGDTEADYHEWHAVQAADGRIIAHVRNHSARDKFDTLQSESTDGGLTWSKPRSIGVHGHPSHLLRLKDGNLLMSYGNRRDYNVEARLSKDNGATWSYPLILADHFWNWDMGYPSTTEQEDGTLLTIWYEKSQQDGVSKMASRRWRFAQ